MKQITKYFEVAATALALTLFAAAEGIPSNNTTNADQLVAANAVLQRPFNAKNAKQGSSITAKLTKTIHLNGTTLPRNTLLVGHVDIVKPSIDDSVSKVVLTFDQARLEDGKKIPIKSTLVGIYPAGTVLTTPQLNPALQTLQEPSGSHGLRLTSNVEGTNSGTLSSNGRNVKLSSGTELQFAVAPSSASGGSAIGG